MESGEEMSNDSPISFSAHKKWLSIPKEMRSKLERNVFCATCLDVVQIINYTVKEIDEQVVLHGDCKKCGDPVARVID